MPNVGSEYVYQPAVDTGSPSSPGDACEFWGRYGPSRGVAMNDDYGESNSEPYLDRRNLTYGWPNRCALRAGVPFAMDGWTTIELYVEYNSANPGQSTLKAWAAPYGEAPRLFINQVNSAAAQQQQRRLSPLRAAELRYAAPVRDEPSDHVHVLRRSGHLDPADQVPGRLQPAEHVGASEPALLGPRRLSPEPPTTFSEYSMQPIMQQDTRKLRKAAAQVTVAACAALGASATFGADADHCAELGHEHRSGHVGSTSARTACADVDPEEDSAANPNYPGTPPWHGSTGQPAVISAWNGAAFASGYGSNGSLVMYGGGHADYYGSEVYAFDMATRTWTRLSNPYKGPFNWPYNKAEYPDGSAIPPHTYDFVEYHPRTNSFVLLKGQTELGPPSNETAVPIAHAFDLGQRKWRRSPQNGDVNIYSGGFSVYDSKRDVFWVEGGSSSSDFRKFDPNTSNADGTFGTLDQLRVAS